MSSKALLVGLNAYPNPANTLRGCINDVLQMSKLLQEGFGFDDANQIRVLTDERATTPAIKDRLRWLLQGTAAGDVLVFHYSGHGAQVRDRHGDELDDGLDEIICPYDLDWDDPFTDDDLYDCLRGLAPGVNLTVVLDCCHSGTGLREAAGAGPSATRSRCLNAPADIQHRSQPLIEDLGPARRYTMTKARTELRLRRFGRRAAAAGATLLAACRSDQVSADAWIDGDFHGAFTYFLCSAAEEGKFRLTYADLLARTRELLLANRYDQVPQLEGPREVQALPVFAPFGVPVTAA
jgi:hypothetical protein